MSLYRKIHLLYIVWLEEVVATHVKDIPISLQKKIKYCKFGNFGENFIFANSVISHICDVKNSRLGHDLPFSVNDRMISPFREGYIFTNKQNPREIFRTYSIEWLENV